MKKLSISQLITLELLLNKECTLQGKPRVNLRTPEQNKKLGIPLSHTLMLFDINHKNSSAPRMTALFRELIVRANAEIK